MATPWSATDRGLLFGRMYEDPAIELAAFPRGGRIFTIASAGCTAFALACRGDSVTAVDLNAAQIAYVRARLAGSPPRRGLIDRGLGLGRLLFPLAGIGPSTLRSFLELDDVERQAATWRSRIDTRGLRAFLRVAFAHRVLGLTPARAFRSVLPPRYGDVIRSRLARGFATHPNRTNRFAWRLFLGREAPETQDVVPRGGIKLVHAEAVRYLEAAPPASFDGFSLSNIIDGADALFAERLHAAVRRAARPGARYVLRSFAEPANDVEAREAARDRSHLWGRIVVDEAA